MTGKNPGKHGVFDFRARPSDPFSEEFVTADWIGCESIWEILNRHGIRVGAVNVPMTYPPFSGSDCMISGMMTPGEHVTFSHPDDLLEELRRGGIDYRLDYNHAVGGRVAPVTETRLLLKALKSCELVRRDACVSLMRTRPVDVFMVVLGITDHVPHLCWNYHEQQMQGAEGGDDDELCEAVRDAYRLSDLVLGDLLEECGEETTVIVMSDHGFGPTDMTFAVNRWLEEQGFLRYRRRRGAQAVGNIEWRVRRRTVEGWLARLGLSGVTGKLPTALRTQVVPLIAPRRKISSEDIDWSKTVAYASGAGIYVNVEARSPEGCVPAGPEHEKVREEIIAALSTVTDPQSQRRLLDVAWRKEEIYTGPFVDEAPDLFFSLGGFRYLPNTDFGLARTFRPNLSGTHRLEGVLMMRGPAIRAGAQLDQASIMDIAPTLLYLLNLPIPSDMDGKLLREALWPEHMHRHPALVTDVEQPAYRERGKTPYSAQDAASMKERLKGLGYL
ncbi:MAG: hypothetical protein AUJ92_16395 [Armatimonadetes bacterium CG2_30_59_28]|nr:MAG: hypothetical protein AUJ92_16395 [Armatimonadetes bacterium CG2_30_59_28]